jgi:hypothetical protein
MFKEGVNEKAEAEMAEGGGETWKEEGRERGRRNEGAY